MSFNRDEGLPVSKGRPSFFVEPVRGCNALTYSSRSALKPFVIDSKNFLLANTPEANIQAALLFSAPCVSPEEGAWACCLLFTENFIFYSSVFLTGFVSSTIGASGATVLGKTVVANILKLIPVVGTAAGGAISGATAGLLTTALGEAYISFMDMMYRGEIKQMICTVKKANR